MKNILILTDFSAGAARVAEYGLAIAAKLGADILLANVYPITPYLPPVGLAIVQQSSPAEKLRESTAQLEREAWRLEKLRQGVAISGHRPVIRTVPMEGLLAECAVQLARKENSILILMGVSERSYGDFLFDGDVKAVVQLADCPVLVVPAAWSGAEIRHILLATDLAEEDQQVLGQLVNLSGLLKARVSVSHVSRPVLIPDFAEEIRVSAFMEKITDLYPGVSCYQARGTNIVTALEQTSEDRQADVIALRYQKHPVFYRLFHENPLKDAIAGRKMPLLVFPGNAESHE